jgi:formate hydrogenlyase subunit 6/NADH:ubiquinone oxidoreductase subunit I
MAVKILLEPCINCGMCRRVCPTETILFFTTRKRTHVVEPAGCIDCDKCVHICPELCIVHDDDYVHEAVELAAAKEKAKAWAGRQNEKRKAIKARAAAAAVAARSAAHA